MTINFNVTGQDRKRLVGAISKKLNLPLKYLGAPGFQYRVGEYEIDKNGTVTGADNIELVTALREAGFDSAGNIILDRHTVDEPAADENKTYQAELSDPEVPDRMEVFGAANDLEACRWCKEEYCTDEVLLLELKEMDENYDIIRGVDIEALIAENGLYDSFAVEIPKNGMYDSQVANLHKLADSKATLLTKALGSPLKIEDAGENVRFVFPYSEETGIGDIYSQFAAAMVRYVRKHQRVNGKEAEPSDNPKFDLRVFLVKIGLKGADTAACRRFFLRNLEGNSAFKSAESRDKWSAKHLKNSEEVGEDE